MKLRQVVYWFLSIAFTLASVAAAAFIFPQAFYRCQEALMDLWQSIVYYFSFVAGAGELPLPSATQYSDVLDLWFWLPETWEQFQAFADAYWSLLFDATNWNYFSYLLGLWVEKVSQVLLLILPMGLILYVLAARVYKTPNNDHDMDSRPLQIFKQISKIIFEPVKSFVLGFVSFLKDNDWIWKPWAALWAINFNLVSIITGFLAFYFYFAVSCDLENIFLQIFKLFIDMQFMFLYIPLIGWLIMGYLALDAFRKNIGRNRLKHMEARNCGFIKELPVVSMACGSMGKKKTTLITDMTMTQDMMFRQQAFEILKKCDMKFPFFPWISFENEIKAIMAYHVGFNLHSIKSFMGKKRRRWEKHHDSDLQLYGYDVQKYGDTFDDGLSVSSIFDVLEVYALAYFVYVLRCSLIISNYAIRTEDDLYDLGNFPMRCPEFFPEHTDTDGRYSHILDFDALRLGKKLIQDNPYFGTIEFGVFAISEIGKERGNNLENQEEKKKSDVANPKNDLFNSWLKLSRHSSTIDNFPFMKIFVDDQRASSWGADARELADVLQIVSSSDNAIAVPFYTIEDMIYEWIYERFRSMYYSIRFYRGDNTLLVYLLKTVAAAAWRRNLRYWNMFGYCALNIQRQSGSMKESDKIEDKQYFLLHKKIYSRRFCTDCFSEFFSSIAADRNVGMGDFPEYAAGCASVDELRQQNSYFIRSLYGDGKHGS